MSRDKKNIISHLYLIIICVLCLFHGTVLATDTIFLDTTPSSKQLQALNLLKKKSDLTQSKFWPNVHPIPFLQNLKKNIEAPLSLYEGNSTNFCGYAALSYLPLHDDPLSYLRFMLQLYIEGSAQYSRENFDPSIAVKLTAGTLSFKGELDVNPADQLWFLALADHFKGYVNFLDHHYDPGNENTMWASVNFSKFNRMIRKLFNYHVKAVGSDLMRPNVRDEFEYLSKKINTGTIALFVNNLDLYKKNHSKVKMIVPTHYVILLDIRKVEDKIAITYWDYGGKTLQMVSPKFLKRILFGITYITPKKIDVE